MRAFKLNPRDMQQINARIDYIYNAKGIGQWFSIQETNEGRVLFLITEPEDPEENHLTEPRHRGSDPI